MGRNFVNVLKCLQFFINLLMRYQKLRFVIAPVQTSRSKHIRRGWCVSDFLWKKIAVTNANFFASDLAVFCHIRKATDHNFQKGMGCTVGRRLAKSY